MILIIGKNIVGRGPFKQIATSLIGIINMIMRLPVT